MNVTRTQRFGRHFIIQSILIQICDPNDAVLRMYDIYLNVFVFELVSSDAFRQLAFKILDWNHKLT